jgi:hypothetical protein
MVKKETEEERRRRLIAAGRPPNCTCTSETFTEFVNPLKYGICAGGHNVTRTVFFKCQACINWDAERARKQAHEREAMFRDIERKAIRVLAGACSVFAACLLAFGSLGWFLLPEGASWLITVPLGVLAALVSLLLAYFSSRVFWRWV